LVRLTARSTAISFCLGLAAVSGAASLADALSAGAGSRFLAVAGGASLIAGGVYVGVRRALRACATSPVDGRTSDLLEVAGIDDDGTYTTKGGGVGMVIVLEGLDYGSRAESDADALGMLRLRAYRDACRAGLTVKVLVRRRRREPIAMNTTGHDVLDAITTRWQARFRAAAFDNIFFVMLEAKGGEPRKMRDAARAFIDGLREYHARQLTAREVVALEAEKINGRPVTIAGGDRLEDVVEVVRLGFDDRAGRVIQREDGKDRVTGVASVMVWGGRDDHRMVDGVLTVPREMEVLLVFQPVDRDMLALSLPQDKRQATIIMSSSEQAREYDDVLARVVDDVDLLVPSMMTIFVSGTSHEGVEATLTDLRQWLRQQGHELRSETACIEVLWRSRLIGYLYMVRERRLQLSNIASLLRFDAPPPGLTRCDWGEGPVRVFPTIAGAQYPLVLHESARESAVAHTLIVGSTGGGKTALALHLLGGILGYPSLKVVAFDSGQGMRPFCEAVGSYVRVSETGPGLNPLETMVSERDEAFVNKWLRMLAGVDGSDAYEAAQRAIEAIRDVAVSRRTLEAVWKQAFDAGPLKDGLRRWSTPSGIGRIFNGRDGLEFASSITGFAMDELYDAPEAVAAVVDYIVHRILGLAAKGEGFALFIDEAPRLLRSAVFRATVKTWLLEIRKAHGAVILAFQTPKAIFETDIASVIIESCATKILIPNTDASWEDYEALGVTRSQFEFIRRPEPGTYRVLVIKRGESVVLDVDLTALGGLFRFYRGGPREAIEINDLRERWGDEWVWHYTNES